MLRLFLRDLSDFLQAIARHWKLLMGSGIMLVIKLFEKGSGPNSLSQLFWTLTFGFIAVAMFYAWRDERRKGEQPELLALDLKELVAEYRAYTIRLAKRLTKKRLGKLYSQSWPIKNIDKREILLETPSDHPDLLLHFSRKWAPYLDSLRKGQQITVQGRIASLSEERVTLTGCELDTDALAKQEGDPSR